MRPWVRPAVLNAGVASDREPDVYVMTALSFGDRPAAAIASLALQKTAENGSEQYPDAATTIINNSYVDDIIDSFASKQTAEERVEQINKILATGGFKIKNWIYVALTINTPIRSSIRLVLLES